MGKLAEAMAKLDKDSVIDIVIQNLKSEKDPLEIIEELRKGMEIVGEGFEKLERFLMDLIWAAQIFKDATELIMPLIKEKKKDVQAKGKVVIGTVKGDIHDIGKNLIMALLECAGFEVVDLGVREKLKIIVGGGVVGDQWTKGKVKADAVTTSAVEGVKRAEKYVEAK
jgi:methanogenic corrinoid protein MtbC1